MTVRNPAIVGDGAQFRLGPRPQTSWGVSMGTAFFFGETGAGLYFVSQFYDLLPGMIAGLLMVALGKGGGHLLHLGQPMRGWRAFAKIGRSWISRGLFAIVVFCGCATVHIADRYLGLLPQPLSALFALVAILACLVVMVYQGFAMAHSSSLALWSTGLMPIASLTYSLLNGIVLTLLLGLDTLRAAEPYTVRLLQVVALVVLMFGVVTMLSVLHSARYGTGGSKHAMEQLVRGPYAAKFLGLVMGAGLVVPAALLGFAPINTVTLVLVAAAELTGCYAFRLLMFKAAAYEPALSCAPRFNLGR